MNASAVELFAHAAERAKDVAVMMDAARALTLLGRSRLTTEHEDGDTVDEWQALGLYQTAERLGQHVRQMSSEARTLLLTARQMLEAEPDVEAQLPADFPEVCRLMDEAMGRAVEAIDRLELLRRQAVPSTAVVRTPPLLVQRTVDDLMSRLRRH